MHRAHYFSHKLFLIALLTGSCSASVCQAVSYTITIDTLALVGESTPPAPFALEFQLNDGEGTVANSIVLSNFDFGGGTANGTPVFNCSSGSDADCAGMSGDLFSSVTLGDGADAFNEFIQAFTPGGSGPLTFLLDLGTPQSEPSTPDAFSLAIFDSSGTGIPTDFFDVFVQIDLSSPVAIHAYASDASQSGIEIGIPTVELATPVSEPNALALLGCGLALLWRRIPNRHSRRR